MQNEEHFISKSLDSIPAFLLYHYTNFQGNSQYFLIFSSLN
ncbi:hypothetical protein HMPREF9381_2270 [Streptococcus sanguinis SK72]|uniref:Uncharacterized protein n=1 Tax=Streptococcus sanguinis SK72 TaxID=888809 RepID=F0I530_STRSA|nr:hypothetical protein HMPREF9381_2270 [Streptococcus sanguinis SK72]